MSEAKSILYLSRGELEGLPISNRAAVDAIEALLHGRAAGTVWNTPKSFVHPDEVRYFMSTLSVANEPRYAAVKSLGLSHHNAARGLDHISALITLFDSYTGEPLAVMDGNWVTAIRTAGLSAAAAIRLARPDSSSVAFIGCGVQAHSHLHAFLELFPLTEVRAFGRGAPRRDEFCEAATALGLSAKACDTAHDAVAGADLVITTVPESPDLNPFLDAEWLAPGSFTAMVDLARPWRSDSLAALDRIVIDDLIQEAGINPPMLDRNLMDSDLTALVAGDAPGRESPAQKIAFVFRGLAIGDLALAGLAYDEAKRHGLGTVLPR